MNTHPFVCMKKCCSGELCHRDCDMVVHELASSILLTEFCVFCCEYW
jgi:hypothetical protein